MTKLELNNLSRLLLAGSILVNTLPLTGSELSSGFDKLINEGKPTANIRLRFEQADQDGLGSSDALTIRSRLGFLSGKVNGFQGFIEMEDIHLLNDQDDVNLANSNPAGAGRTNVPDPEATELNRVWVSWSDDIGSIKLGRARIKLDDDRFIGNVGWRQNEQTFDMLSLKGSPIESLDLFASYIWKVQRIFGDATGALPDFEGDNFVVNGGYTFSKSIKLVGFAYLLDLQNALTGASFSGSGNTFGLRATGSLQINEGCDLAYAISYANQSDNSGNPASGPRSDFDLDYFALDAKLKLGAGFIGFGSEILEGDGTNVFATPLATVHAFQGWADTFLGNSISGTGLGGGIEDLYLSAGYTVPVGNGLSLTAFYHWFDTESSASYGDDYGTEFDLVAVYPINKYFKAIAKFAAYEGDASPGNPKSADIDKFWIELNFLF